MKSLLPFVQDIIRHNFTIKADWKHDHFVSDFALAFALENELDDDDDDDDDDYYVHDDDDYDVYDDDDYDVYDDDDYDVYDDEDDYDVHDQIMMMKMMKMFMMMMMIMMFMMITMFMMIMHHSQHFVVRNGILLLCHMRNPLAVTCTMCRDSVLTTICHMHNLYCTVSTHSMAMAPLKTR